MQKIGEYFCSFCGCREMTLAQFDYRPAGTDMLECCICQHCAEGAVRELKNVWRITDRRRFTKEKESEQLRD